MNYYFFIKKLDDAKFLSDEIDSIIKFQQMNIYYIRKPESHIQFN